MIGNSQLPGVATEPRHRARAIENQAINSADHAMRWARDACVPGEYVETLVPELLWAIDKAAQVLAGIEHHLRAPLPPNRAELRLEELSA